MIRMPLFLVQKRLLKAIITMLGGAVLLSACAATLPVQPTSEAAARDRKVPGTNVVIWEPFVDEAEAYYVKRVQALEKLEPLKGGVYFVGDSITEGMLSHPDMFPDVPTANYGISWDTTRGLGERLEQITRHSPEKIFVMIGTNNHMYDHSSDGILISTLAVIDVLHEASPQAEIYLQSILPRETEANSVLQNVNKRLQERASEEPYIFLNLAPHFANSKGELEESLTNDGLHLNAKGYQLWEKLIDDCVRAGCAGLKTPSQNM